MPAYTVQSGDFSKTIVRSSPTAAAHDAIGTLRFGDFDQIKLGMMTIIIDVSDPSEPLFLPTLPLVRRHGLDYTRKECV